MLRARDRASPKGLAVVLFASLAFPFAARAVDLDLKLEPGAAVSLSRPQSQRFEFGGAATIKGLAGFEGGYVNLTAGLTFLGLPAQTGFGSSSVGTAWAPGVGLRIQLPRESDQMRALRPHGREAFYGAKPWVDGDVLYVRTGGLDRVGFATAVGLSFPVGEARSFQLGPFVRYLQIFQGNRPGFDNRNANTIIFGLSLETGTRLPRPQAIEPMEQAPLAMAVATAAPAERRDRDGDGVSDDVDDCPDIRGLASNRGCPIYEKIIVRPDKLELKEKIQFAWNDSAIEPVSYPALAEVAKALQDNPAFRVAIEGHASSEGGDDHNQSLSSRRAEAVLEYVASHGVARDRLLSKGFSSSRPIQSNYSESGRVANRRVEFVVHFIILKEGGLQ
jgi:outer membrane protein OmpA-like peptidoglycan-associated protein